MRIQHILLHQKKARFPQWTLSPDEREIFIIFVWKMNDNCRRNRGSNYEHRRHDRLSQ